MPRASLKPLIKPSVKLLIPFVTVLHASFRPLIRPSQMNLPSFLNSSGSFLNSPAMDEMIFGISITTEAIIRSRHLEITSRALRIAVQIFPGNSSKNLTTDETIFGTSVVTATTMFPTHSPILPTAKPRA